MNVNYRSLFGVLAGMTLFSHTAMAACPGVFGAPGVYCNGSTGAANCTNPSTYQIDCTFSSASTGVTGYFVTPTSTSFRAYGYDADGEAFCCEFSGVNDGCSSNKPTITIYGTDYPDTLTLNDPIAGLDLDCSNTYLYADAGDDTITGSFATTNNDNLYGEDGSDVIHGRDGNDHIYGGYGDDYLYGDDDGDYIWGGYGDDHIKGGSGNDELYGEGDYDAICGGYGDDALDGGDNDDVITGENGTDTNDGAANDALGGDTCEWDSASNCESYTGHDSSCTW